MRTQSPPWTKSSATYDGRVACGGRIEQGVACSMMRLMLLLAVALGAGLYFPSSRELILAR